MKITSSNLVITKNINIQIEAYHCIDSHQHPAVPSILILMAVLA